MKAKKSRKGLSEGQVMRNVGIINLKKTIATLNKAESRIMKTVRAMTKVLAPFSQYDKTMDGYYSEMKSELNNIRELVVQGRVQVDDMKDTGAYLQRDYKQQLIKLNATSQKLRDGWYKRTLETPNITRAGDFLIVGLTGIKLPYLFIKSIEAVTEANQRLTEQSFTLFGYQYPWNLNNFASTPEPQPSTSKAAKQKCAPCATAIRNPEGAKNVEMEINEAEEVNTTADKVGGSAVADIDEHATLPEVPVMVRTAVGTESNHRMDIDDASGEGENQMEVDSDNNQTEFESGQDIRSEQEDDDGAADMVEMDDCSQEGQEGQEGSAKAMEDMEGTAVDGNNNEEEEEKNYEQPDTLSGRSVKVAHEPEKGANVRKTSNGAPEVGSQVTGDAGPPLGADAAAGPSSAGDAVGPEEEDSVPTEEEDAGEQGARSGHDGDGHAGGGEQEGEVEAEQALEGHETYGGRKQKLKRRKKKSKKSKKSKSKRGEKKSSKTKKRRRTSPKHKFKSVDGRRARRRNGITNISQETIPTDDSDVDMAEVSPPPPPPPGRRPRQPTKLKPRNDDWNVECYQLSSGNEAEGEPQPSSLSSLPVERRNIKQEQHEENTLEQDRHSSEQTLEDSNPGLHSGVPNISAAVNDDDGEVIHTEAGRAAAAAGISVLNESIPANEDSTLPMSNEAGAAAAAAEDEGCLLPNLATVNMPNGGAGIAAQNDVEAPADANLIAPVNITKWREAEKDSDYEPSDSDSSSSSSDSESGSESESENEKDESDHNDTTNDSSEDSSNELDSKPLIRKAVLTNAKLLG